VHPGIAQRADINSSAHCGDPVEAVDGANQIFRLTVEHFLPDSSVMDLGAGTRHLLTLLPLCGKKF